MEKHIYEGQTAQARSVNRQQTYDIEFWGTAVSSNIEGLQNFQNNVRRMIVNSPYYVPNTVNQQDIPIPIVK